MFLRSFTGKVFLSVQDDKNIVSLDKQYDGKYIFAFSLTIN